MTFVIYIAAALAEVGGCFAFWAWLRLGKSILWIVPGTLSLLAFASLLALVPSDAFAVAAPGGDEPPDAVRLCLGAAPDQRALYQSLATLAATLQENSGEMTVPAVV